MYLQCSYNLFTKCVGVGMITSNDIVRARVTAEIKSNAVKVLDEMGLSVSDAIRMLLIRIAKEQAMPFDVKVPNAHTREAIKDIKDGAVRTLESFEDLLDDMDAEITRDEEVQKRPEKDQEKRPESNSRNR